MPHLITTLGPKSGEELGMILPHEHIFVDLRAMDQPGFGQADVQDVVKLMAPELEKARTVGVTALVECSPVGVGRNINILKAVSQATNFPLVVPTGIYREPWVPAWAHQASEDKLYEWMRVELDDQIENTGVQADFIKLSAGDDGITEVETKILRAAARAARETGAIIGSHTIRGRVVRDQLDIIEALGLSANKFIWIHASAEPDVNLNLEMGKRGAWIEYDFIGSQEGADEETVKRLLKMTDAGLAGQVLLSMDRGWYDPAQPGGGTPKPFTYLSEKFVPKLIDAGFDSDSIHMLTQRNPFNAFAR